MKKNRTTRQLRFFHCPVCHSIMTATKPLSRGSEKRHRKNMYCYSCKEKQRFIMDDTEIVRQ